ncbi:hypothetical protein AVEN_144456-1 [Araneus ventricosus]|uniref:Uncharacterized protein n=1 Tax=Araneus ventricosus TaxID=182803 RepID=A0A4Y2E3R2_ARAVE|nr:hypothetical protein AVEN_144456-1 [Araneus ventricosus]
MTTLLRRPQWSSGKVSALGLEALNPILLKIRRVLGLWHAKSHIGGQTPSPGLVRKLEEELPAQMSFSLSDRGSKLRDPSQNSPCVASNRTFM